MLRPRAEGTRWWCLWAESACVRAERQKGKGKAKSGKGGKSGKSVAASSSKDGAGGGGGEEEEEEEESGDEEDAEQCVRPMAGFALLAREEWSEAEAEEARAALEAAMEAMRLTRGSR